MQRLVCLLTVLCLMPLAASGKTVHRVLSNGLTVVVKEDRSSPVVAMQAWVKTGSVTEGKYMGSGLSHYYEHMLFKGTKKLKVGDYSAQIRAAGGADLNAYTTTNRTVYHFTILSKHFDLGLRNLSDILMNATFPEDEVKKEMPVIFREMDQGADNPDKVMWLSFMQTMYKVHPYRHPVIGYKQVFQALTRDAILDYYKSGYSPSNIIFIVVGDVDAEQAAAKIARQFEPYKRRSIQPVFVPREPEPTIARRLEKRFHVKKARLRIGWKTVSARHPDMPALDLLSAILGSGESSRLVRSLKDRKQLVLSTSAWSWTPKACRRSC